MEVHPSKRRRVGHGDDRPVVNHNFDEKGRKRAGSLADRRDKQLVPKLVLPAHHAFGVHGASPQKPQHVHDSPPHDHAALKKIQARQLLGTHVNKAGNAVPQAASTVLAIAIDNGSGIVSEMEVPMTADSVSIPGYGMITMASDGAKPTLTQTPGKQPINPNPGVVTPPPAVAASIARDEALQTQQAIAHQLNVVPQAPSNTPPNAIQTPSEAAAAPSQSPIVINAPESQSQQILSTPPTPVPATPQPSASSFAGPSASYFSTSPASISNSSPPQISNPPITSQSPGLNNPSSNNSTLSATSFSSSSFPTSSSFNFVSSEASASASSLSAQSTELQASSLSSASLAALSSSTRSPSGFSTSTLSSQTYSTGSSSSATLTTSTPSISASSSTPSSTLASASSQSTASPASSSFPSENSSSATDGAGLVGGPNNTGAAASPTSSSGASSNGSGSPPASVLAGGIVGGIAGATILLLIILLLFRWRRSKMKQQRQISPPIPQTLGVGAVPEPGDMTQRSSTTPIAGAGFFSRLRPTSAQTATTADTAPSERGFQKISGRKLPSVLASGGDGYGDNTAAGPSGAGAASGEIAGGAAAGAAAAGAAASTSGPSASKARGVAPGQGPFAGLYPALRPGSPQRSLSGSSFYRDSHGFYGGVVPESTTQPETDASSTPSTSPSYPAPLNVAGRQPQDRGGPFNRQSEVAITRPGPARTPVINEPSTVPIRTPSRANQPPPRPARGTSPPPQNPFRDALGRSHPSQDGSRGSRFREDTTPP